MYNNSELTIISNLKRSSKTEQDISSLTKTQFVLKFSSEFFVLSLIALINYFLVFCVIRVPITVMGTFKMISGNELLVQSIDDPLKLVSTDLSTWVEFKLMSISNSIFGPFISEE